MIRKLSQQTSELVSQLVANPATWERVIGKSPARPPIIDKIGASGELAAVAYIASFLVSLDEASAEAARSAVHQLLASATVLDLISLDQSIRSRTAYHDIPRQWYDFRPALVARLNRNKEVSTSVLGIISFHASGFVREAAVDELASVTNGLELPFLLIRANDWVEQVRTKAESALKNRLHPEYALHFVKYLPAIERLSTWRRRDHVAFIDSVRSLLKQPDCRSTLLGGLESKDRVTRRICLQLAGETNALNAASVVVLAEFEPDVVVRSILLEIALKQFLPDDLRSVLEALKHDKAGSICRAVLLGYHEQFPDVAGSELRAALLDSRVAVREIARWCLDRTERNDFAAFYRRAIHDPNPKTLAGAISGLGETGLPADADVVAPFCTHTVARIRSRAIRAIARLRADAFISIFLGALADERSTVCREAATALRKLTHSLSVEKIWGIASSDRRPHVQKASLSVIDKFDKWTRLPYLIRACSWSDPDVRTTAHRFVDRWRHRYNKDFKEPRANELFQIRQALDEASEFIEPKLTEELRMIARG